MYFCIREIKFPLMLSVASSGTLIGPGAPAAPKFASVFWPILLGILRLLGITTPSWLGFEGGVRLSTVALHITFALALEAHWKH